jgi:hypothetical protein
MKILVVGINAANGYENCEPIVGVNETGEMCQTGKRWVQWAEELGIDWRACEYRNCRYPNNSIQEWVEEYEHDGIVITLGRTPARAMRHHRYIVALPHPSGLNRQLNDKPYINKRLDDARRTLEILRSMLLNG